MPLPAVAAQLTAIQSALKMLTGRIGLLYQHVQKLDAGKQLYVYAILELASSSSKRADLINEV